MYKLLLTLSIFLTTSVAYCQYNIPNQQNQVYGFLGPNPFDTRYYYPGFALRNDFEVLPDNRFNRNQYPGLFELQQRQLQELKKAKKLFPELYNSPPAFAPNKF